jgi:hypothetical protein
LSNWPGRLLQPATAFRLEVVLPDGVTVRGDDAAAILVVLRALAPRLSC